MLVLIVGGGTGGHLFPAIALAEAFMKRDPENQVRFVVTRRPLDAEVLGRRGLPFRVLNVEGIKGQGAAGKIRSMSLLPRAFKESLEMIEEIRPEVVLGVGGYVTGPMVLAAWWKGIPCAIQEQNSIPGLTNRLLGKVVNRIFLAFDDQGSYFSKRKSRLTGNPIRKELTEAPGRRVSNSGPLTLLILGGSQGAHRINQTVIDTLDELRSFKEALYFIHQTGEKDETAVSLAYQAKGFRHQVQAFFSDMVSAYGQADMIIGRAGAMTISEITAQGKPSLLIPFPFAANNHQEHNARALVKAGAAEMILEKDLKPGLLAERIRHWLNDRDQLIVMGNKAGTMGRRQAAGEIVEACYQLVNEKKGSKRSWN
ncbi:MAG: undecaprenyldiphospho-muramoylpentapeptide beta-N-acetylglucosaminyltransferase [Deltaproteobacteria bacterium]|nr:undecaprenyldiphospho-muramoylpentapeptide beta-N-acetylglucosaminyltransferase [Deltaproteobacteria bacterium]